MLILILYSGLYYQAGKGDKFITYDLVKWGIFIMVLVPSCLFLLYFFGKLRIQVLRKFTEKRFIFKVLSCGLIDIDEFKEEHKNDDFESDEFKFDENDGEGSQVRRASSLHLGLKSLKIIGGLNKRRTT